MESATNLGNVHNAPPHNSGLKFEVTNDDFCIDNFSSSSSSKTCLQDFHHLGQLPLIKATSFCPDIDTHLNVFDPFFHGFDLYEDNNKPYDHGNGMACAAMQSFNGDGFLNSGNTKDLFMDIDAGLIHHDPNPLSILAPDESSCVTSDLGFRFKNGKYGGKERGSAPVKLGRRKAKSGKGQWTTEEDRLLIHLVEKYGEKKWSRIAQLVKGRIGKQCRERWHNHLRPDIKKDLWTEEEDSVLIEAHAEIGNKWAEIAKRLPGRTENSIKNHWNATKRRQLSRRKCRTKWPKPSSLLQNYIKSLNSEKGSKNSAATCSSATHDLEIARKNLSNDVCDMDVSPLDNMVQDYEIDDVPDFSFMDDFPTGPAPQIDEQCFDMDLPFHMPPLMEYGVKEELDFAMG